jgi:hypothetical protein
VLKISGNYALQLFNHVFTNPRAWVYYPTA